MNALKSATVSKEWRTKGAQALRQDNVQNPALQRLSKNLSGQTGLVITSYDRMHHRHNRS